MRFRRPAAATAHPKAATGRPGPDAQPLLADADPGAIAAAARPIADGTGRHGFRVSAAACHGLPHPPRRTAAQLAETEQPYGPKL